METRFGKISSKEGYEVVLLVMERETMPGLTVCTMYEL